jgi:hypothetical protein
VLNEKEMLLEAALENKMTLFFEHDITTECCTVVKGAKGIVADRNFTLAEFLKS